MTTLVAIPPQSGLRFPPHMPLDMIDGDVEVAIGDKATYNFTPNHSLAVY
jgi:hypothetical protein